MLNQSSHKGTQYLQQWTLSGLNFSLQLERLLPHLSCELQKRFKMLNQSFCKGVLTTHNMSISLCVFIKFPLPRTLSCLKVFEYCFSLLFVCLAISPFGMFVLAFGESFKSLTFAHLWLIKVWARPHNLNSNHCFHDLGKRTSFEVSICVLLSSTG